MRSGLAQREDGAPGVTRPVVRLLVLLGVAAAAYLVLSLFDHAARADAGSINHITATDPVASVKTVAAAGRKAIPALKPTIPRSTAPKAHQQRLHRPTAKTPRFQAPKPPAAKKTHAPKIQASSTRAGETVRRIQVRASKLRKPTSGLVRDSVRGTATSVRTAVVRHKLSAPAHLPSMPELVEPPDLPKVVLASWTPLRDLLPMVTVPSWTPLPGLPQAELPAMPQQPSRPQLSGLAQVLARPTALPSALLPHRQLMPPVSAQVFPLPQPPAFTPASVLSDATTPSAAQPQPRTAPLPALPRQPADRSAHTGQARDSGGGSASAMGTVLSSWRPEVAAAGRCVTTDLIARGRTIRYAGPPS
jgi:hypothetical protein